MGDVESGLQEVGSPYRSIESQIPPGGDLGSIRIFQGGGLGKVVYNGMTVEAMGLDSHMIFAFTPPDSPVPHFTLDSVKAGPHFAFHLDLIPRVDLGANLDYLNAAFQPLTEAYDTARKIEGLTEARLAPRQLAIMSPWMLAFRATEEAYRAVEPSIDHYLNYWAGLVKSGLPDESVAGYSAADFATRDQRNRDIIFSVEVDPVWNQILPLTGADMGIEMRKILRNQAIEPAKYPEDPLNPMTNTDQNASKWQERITGEWHGQPSIFDATGNHVGYNKVYRSSIFENGITTYYMDTVMDAIGPLRARFEARDFAFGAKDSDQDRIYMGPDFFGAGHPYGALVDAHYYSPAWTSNLRTMVHILKDGQTQVYSSLLFDGPTINGVFNGIYRVAFDYHENPDTKRDIEAFVHQERKDGTRPHLLPWKHAGRWRGEMDVYDDHQQLIGTNQVSMHYRPTALLRAEMDIEIDGVFSKRFKFSRYRDNYRHSFDGPDLYGNGMAYGRALYTDQHFSGEAQHIRGREFIIDDNFNMSVVWRFFQSDRPLYMTFGLLEWEPGEQVLKAGY